MTCRKFSLGVAALLSVVVANHRASAVTLQDLITAGGSVVQGNQVYSGFSSGGTLPASDVTVNFTSNGLEFSANWNTLTPGANSSVISYDVAAAPTSAGAPQSINGANLFFGGQVIINNATASVGETLTDAADNKDFSMQVFYAGKGAPNNNLRDSVVIDPAASSLHVVKSVDVAASGPNAFASLNFVENAFSSFPGPGGGATPGLPEPMTIALLPLAIVGLGLRKKLER